MLTAAASVGSLAACERLLGAGCIPAFKAALAAAAAGGHLDVMRLLLEKMEAAQQEASAHGDPHLETYKQPAACKAAAKAGQLPALRFLLESTDGAPQSKAIGYAAAGACEGGQLAILHWLQQAHGYSPTLEDAIFAAAGGQAAVLEQLLPALLPADGSRPRPSGDAWEVLQEIAYACPVAVLQRHFGRLCRAAGGPEYLRGNESLLLEAVVGSPTPCWAAKLDFLLSSSALGPDVGARVLVQMRFELYGKASRHGLPRLQHLRALVERVGGVGDVPPADGQSEVKTALAAAQMAAAHGHADALAYLWDECGVPMQLQPHQLLQWPPVAAGPVGYAAARLAVVRLLQERGALFGPADVRQAAFTGLSEEIVLALIDMVLPAAAGGSSPDGGGGDAAAAAAATTAAESTLDRTRLESRDDWAAAFSHAARGGAGVRVLQALRERGAPLNLSAVVVGCSDEVLEWAVEQLEAEEGRVQVGEDLVAEFYRHGNFAALRWLYERGRLEGDAVRWLAGRVELGGIWGCRVTAA
ncbi:hypothetical protein HYH02_005676 [Chlamydomonas schloesseri]|uniref:Uncharacterized protein n=1 Tax=Chlamydomonas schloesseri TaxID=2026947 RepID=A0A835WKS6_9CHLO|nr:hypothetical protein HYH02_005676 [Chlamydomonas schloesseri]|eukprot:KAG2449534.1 hypothetical protein HYH02_005676 [Chlamydomonas schloesseri]